MRGHVLVAAQLKRPIKIPSRRRVILYLHIMPGDVRQHEISVGIARLARAVIFQRFLMPAHPVQAHARPQITIAIELVQLNPFGIPADGLFREIAEIITAIETFGAIAFAVCQ